MASTDALPVPLKNTAYRVVFPILDADGDLVTGAAGLDSEVSKDQGTFADCTNEATEIATASGMYYLDLTSTEMNADCVAVIVKTSTSGAKTTVLTLYPAETGDIPANVTAFGGTAGTFASGRPEVNTTHAAGTAWGSGAITAGAIAADAIGASELAADAVAEIADAVWDEARSGHTTDGTFGQVNQAVRSGTAQGGGTATITLDASASAVDDFYNGDLVWCLSGTGAGQAGVVIDYVGATKVATVDNNWRTNPDSSTGFVILPGSLGLTSATLASAVWDASTSTYNGAGTFGAGVRLSAAAVQAVWDALTSALTTASSIGKRLVDYLTGDIYARLGAPAGASMSADTAAVYARLGAPAGASVSADIAAVQADTDNIQTRLPAALVGGRMDANVGAISTDATAADNLEAALDGTGGVTITAAVTGNITGNLSGSVGSVTGAVGSVTGAVGSVTGNVGGNVVGSVASVTGAVGSVTGNVGGNVTGNLGGTLTSTERNAIADALLARNIAGGSSTGRIVAESLAFMRNKWAISGSTLTVYGTDDTTALWTATITSASGNPVTSVDPA